MLQKLVLLTAIVLMTGCASQGGWSPTVDQAPAYEEPYRNQGYNNGGGHGNHGYNQGNQGYNNNNSSYNNRRNLNRDKAQCRQLALKASKTGQETLMGAGVGAVLGAAGGAIIGGMTGNPGRGAGYGAAAGALGGGASQGIKAETSFKRAYTNCLRRRGHNVIN